MPFRRLCQLYCHARGKGGKRALAAACHKEGERRKPQSQGPLQSTTPRLKGYRNAAGKSKLVTKSFLKCAYHEMH
jgi:hypothetical protein